MSEIELGPFPHSSLDAEDEVVFQIFSDDLSQTRKAQEVYAALCNNIWQREDMKLSYSWRSSGEVVADIRNQLKLEKKDPKTCELCGKGADDHYRYKYKSGISFLLEKKGKEPLFLERLLCQKDGDPFTPGYMGKEDYLDFYCCGGEGIVADWVKEKFRAAGFYLKKKDEINKTNNLPDS